MYTSESVIGARFSFTKLTDVETWSHILIWCMDDISGGRSKRNCSHKIDTSALINV